MSIWTPLQINTDLWLDAADSSTITIATGVSAWADKSGNGRNFSQETPTKQPVLTENFLNGLSALTFDGTDDSMASVAYAAPAISTIFFVLKNPDASTVRIVWEDSVDYNTNAYCSIINANAGPIWDVGIKNINPYYSSNSFSPRSLNPSILSKVYSGLNNLFLYEDGTSLTKTVTNYTASSSATSELVKHYLGSRAGASYFFIGNVCEVICIFSALSDSDRQQIEGYLAWKWGLQANLPVGHPYKSAAPTYDPSASWNPDKAFKITPSLPDPGTELADIKLPFRLKGTIPWTPSLIDTILWLDAADASTITMQTGVKIWGDKSGYSNYAQNTDTTKQPALSVAAINGLNAITFDGSDDQLVGQASLWSGNNPGGMFVVYKPLTLTGVETLFGQSIGTTSSTWRVFYFRTDGAVGDPYFGGYNNDLNDNQAPVSTVKIAGFTHDGTTSKLYRTGNLIASGAKTLNTTATPYRVAAASNYYEGHVTIAEIVCTADITDLNRQKVEGYLAWKWGLQADLPSDHPYKSAAPVISQPSSGLTNFDTSAIFDELSTIDPYWDKVVLAVPFDGVNNSTTFIDISKTPKTVTKYGDAKISTAQSKFGGSSAYFDGDGDYLSVPDHNDLDLDYVDPVTIECWVWVSANPASGVLKAILHKRYTTNPARGYALYLLDSGKIQLFAWDINGNTVADFTSSVSVLLSQFNHIALVREGATSWKIYLNGVNVASGIQSGVIGNHDAVFGIGFDPTNITRYFNGYIDDLRITKGVARYTADFTPPTKSISETSPAYYYANPNNKKIALMVEGGDECPIEIQPDSWDAVNKTAMFLATIPSLTSATVLNFYYDSEHEDNSNVIDITPLPDPPTDPYELAVYNLGLSDQLWTWSDIAELLETVSLYLDQPVALLHIISFTIDQPCGSELQMTLDQWVKDAGSVSMTLDQWVKNLQEVTLNLIQPMGIAATVTLSLDQPCKAPALVKMILDQPITIAGQTVMVIIDQPVSMLDTSGSVSVTLNQPCSMANGSTQVDTISLSVTVAGLQVNPDYVNLRSDDQDGFITAAIRFPDYDQYAFCQVGDEVVITEYINGAVGDVTVLQVDSLSNPQETGSSDHIISAISPTIILDKEPLTEDLGPGIADVLLTDLCARYGVVLDWQSVAGWPFLAGELVANNETAYSVIRRVATAAGAFLQPMPDGSLRVLPGYPVNVDQWLTAPVVLDLTDQDHIFSIDDQPDPRDGDNLFLLSGVTAASDKYRLEEVEKSPTTKEIRCYMSPWDSGANIVLGHTGGDWVTIEALNSAASPMVELIEKEEIEIIAGLGSASFPVGKLVSVAYKQDPLGEVTARYDGTVSTAEVSDALIEMTYQTKYLRWLVTDPREESLQIYIEEVA